MNNIFELVRAVRKRLAVANTFELRVAKEQASHYAKLWHEATDRISVLGEELRSMKASRDHLAETLEDFVKVNRREYARGLETAAGRVERAAVEMDAASGRACLALAEELRQVAIWPTARSECAVALMNARSALQELDRHVLKSSKKR